MIMLTIVEISAQAETTHEKTSVPHPVESICFVCKHLCAEAVVLDNGVSHLESCAHIFCKQCVTPIIQEY